MLKLYGYKIHERRRFFFLQGKAKYCPVLRKLPIELQKLILKIFELLRVRIKAEKMNFQIFEKINFSSACKMELENLSMGYKFFRDEWKQKNVSPPPILLHLHSAGALL